MEGEWENKGHTMGFLHKIASDMARMFKDSSLGGIYCLPHSPLKDFSKCFPYKEMPSLQNHP
jgi:hypothetical protein